MHPLQTPLQILTREPAPKDPIRDEQNGLVRPRVVQVVDRVLERAGDAVVVLGAQDDVAVVSRDLRVSVRGVLVRELGVGGHGARDHGFVEDGEVEGGDVDDGELDVDARGLGGRVEDGLDELGDGGAYSHGARGADDEGDLFGGEEVRWVV
jgi:hypothetical protein